MLLLALLSLCAVVYVHYRLVVQRSKSTWIAQLLLIVTGLAFGWTMHSAYVDLEGYADAWVFILAFGCVHVPGAIILWLKKQRSKPPQ